MKPSLKLKLKLKLSPAQLPLIDADGNVTERGAAVLTSYARARLAEKGEETAKLEQAYPSLRDLFYDIRSDVIRAEWWAAT